MAAAWMMARQAPDYRASPVIPNPDCLFLSQGIESSGQPCTKMITGRCAPPQAREKVVCLALLAICSVTGNDMETFLPVPRLMRGTAGNVVRCINPTATLAEHTLLSQRFTGT